MLEIMPSFRCIHYIARSLRYFPIMILMLAQLGSNVMLAYVANDLNLLAIFMLKMIFLVTCS